jgi:hypothetical protein
MFVDLSTRDSEATEQANALSAALREHDLERRLLAEQAAARFAQIGTLDERERHLTEENRALSAEAERLRGAKQIVLDCQAVLATEGSAGPTASGSEVPSRVAALREARDAAAMRAEMAEAALGETAAKASRLVSDHNESGAELAACRAALEEASASSRREGTARDGELSELKSELEGAAELAERQNALTLTLEGRLDALSSERQLLQQQLAGVTGEADDTRAALVRALTSLLPPLRPRLSRTSLLPSAAAALLDDPTSGHASSDGVCARACDAMRAAGELLSGTPANDAQRHVAPLATAQASYHNLQHRYGQPPQQQQQQASAAKPFVPYSPGKSASAYAGPGMSSAQTAAPAWRPYQSGAAARAAVSEPTRTTSSARPPSPGAIRLQERLRKAQQSFMSMQE